MRAITGLTSVMLAVAALGACSNPLSTDGSVSIEAPNPAAEVAAVCEDLSAALPDEVAGGQRTDADPPSELTEAWGSPAIVLRCGVGEPAAFRPTSQVATVNGVDWFPEELEHGYVFTTWGRTVNVEVTVPDDYAPEVNPLVDLANPIKDTIPKV